MKRNYLTRCLAIVMCIVMLTGESVSAADVVMKDALSVSGNGIADEIEIFDEEPVDGNIGVSQNEINNGMFPGLDDGFAISSRMLDDKALLSEHVDQNNDLEEGRDYVEDRILVEAAAPDEAEKYAEAFNGELVSYNNDLAVIELNEDPERPEATVIDAVVASADERTRLPAAWPDYYRYLCDDIIEPDISKPAVEAADQGSEPDMENDTDSCVNKGDEEELPWYAMTPEDIEISPDGGTVEFYDEDGEIVADGGSISDQGNDPMLKPTDEMYQWHHDLIGSKYAWQAGYTGAGVKVCVIDTGIIDSHEDITTVGKRGCGEDGISAATDINGHGTNVSGIIKATGNNLKGGSGVAYGASLYVINVNKSNNSISDSGLISAIDYAVNTYKVDVINISITGSAYSEPLKTSVQNAYKNGVAVFCAAGNESTNAIGYPARYKGAISVAAVDRNNKLTYFSNRGDIDFTGPGVDIYSVANDSSSSYDSMSGTSQATPAIAGVGAVLLSTGRVTGTGETKVENLKSWMESGCIKSGVGKGTPNLAKCLGLTTSLSAPSEPSVDTKPGTYDRKSVNVKFNSIPGATIYYTIDGSGITYKAGVISSNAKAYTAGNTISMTGSSKAVLRALTVSDTNRLASRQVAFTYNLKPKADSVTVSGKNRVNTVKRGANLQIEAAVSPAYVADKKVKWTVTASDMTGISINASGLLMVSAGAKATSCTVTATTLDGSNKSGTLTVTIASPDKCVKTIKPRSDKLTVYNGKTVETDIDVTMSDGTEPGGISGYVKVTSSDTSVATAAISGKTLKITGVSSGKAVMTLAAADGSGIVKKVNVTVKQYVTGVNITYPNVNGYITAGKGFTAKAAVLPAAASDQKVTWSLYVVPSSTTIDDCGVKVNPGSGKVTTSAKTVAGQYGIQATAADGSNVYNRVLFYIREAKSGVKSISLGSSKLTIFRVRNAYSCPNGGQVVISAINASGDKITDKNYLTVTSSNPGIVTAACTASYLTVLATGKGTGTAIITVASTDGSGIRKELKVTVVNPPSAIRLALPEGRSDHLARGKSIKLSTIIETDYGPVSNASTKFTYKSSNPSCISVNGSGKVKAKSSVGYATITATAKDGSGVQARYSVYCCANITKMVPYTRNVVIKLNETGTVGAAKIFVSSLADLSGTPSYEFDVKVNKQGLGIKKATSGGVAAYGAYIIGNKKGKYKVTIAPNDGSSGKCTINITVR